ncbi:MAG: hypothetical protein ACRDY5_06225, partial [Acidimicrobiales bacterium]
RRARRAKSHTKRRRRSHHMSATNPRRRRRRGSHRRVHARRRHGNPRALGLGGLNVSVSQFGKAVMGAGVGAIGARVVSNAIKNQFFPAATPLVKIGIEAGVGILSGVVLGGMLKQRALAAGVAAGAAVVVALDLYDLYLKPALPAMLQDYQYGTLSDWAPQATVEDYQYGSLSGGNVYEDNVYGGG